ncbi:sensor histidine kinase efflux regulator BaeS [Acinetobacter sp. FNA3]|uniref:sensor histidine kinase efflux regulator BaeS n=1 Tax=Acinetobacter pollinis TaxID=2605270 RepID=UPI0018A2C2F1|nr:sensor histidine kinase efflux regulator BaeS [Acinetobacter pollinis]MBF7691402.1 sensor histidine kinase efflux regulator BaeS [Acinetobacter pollinis]MBF7694114.1 sensor histidine kinase efflux regulator BaeS [Acinetobacter pollinis]MBF7699073.1 sensor histidine kinase efflux regulator BaeS [Acinetobacter pollinis]
MGLGIKKTPVNNRRIPIALRLFSTVLLTTLIITTVSLGVFQWTMKQNFAKYVADVEMQKLDHLIENLAGIYSVYHDWGDAIQAQILQVEGIAAPDDFDRLSRTWLRRQYDIAFQQRYFKENAVLSIPTGLEQKTDRLKKQTLTESEIRQIQQNLPSEFQPFEGLKFPLKDNFALFGRPKDGPPEMEGGNNRGNPSAEDKVEMIDDEPVTKKFIPMPDRFGLSSRLSLYDAKKRFVVGQPPQGAVSYRPILVNGIVIGYLGLKPVLDQDDILSLSFFSTQKRVLLLIYAVTFFASLLLALLLATYFKKPIQKLLQATQELTKGNYQHKVKVGRNDELGDLSNQINRLASILDQHENSRKQWVADTSHELKTPLAVLQAQIEAMQDGIRKATPEHLTSMMSQVSSLKKLTQDLADLAQVEAQQLKCYFAEMDPWKAILQEVNNFQSKFEQAHLTVRTQGTGIILMLDHDRFKQVIVNLLSNSVRYTEQYGEIYIHTHQTDTYWSVIVDDSPLGLTDDQLKRLGERFYRVDDSRTRATGGTGLGLALSAKIIQALGGELSFDHSPLGGLRCTLTFLKEKLN